MWKERTPKVDGCVGVMGEMEKCEELKRQKGENEGEDFGAYTVSTFNSLSPRRLCFSPPPFLFLFLSFLPPLTHAPSNSFLFFFGPLPLISFFSFSFFCSFTCLMNKEPNWIVFVTAQKIMFLTMLQSYQVVLGPLLLVFTQTQKMLPCALLLNYTIKAAENSQKLEYYQILTILYNFV